MAVIKCKMCGGDLVIEPGSTVAECEFCGSKQTIPNQDDDKKLTLFARANRLRMGSEFDKAAGIYESIVADFPEEAEAYWGLVLCKYGIEYVDDPASGKKIPTCHRSSFDSVMEDADFEQALENADGAARKVYRDEAKQIEEIRKGIIEVSGKEEPYDIFICYKETAANGDRTIDSVIAQDVYDALTAKGYRVFFSRITLEDKLGQEYEPYIFAALNSAKIMLAFGTDYEYYNAVWVKNEWSRYLKLMAKDKSKHLIPCYKNIDAYDMPKEFAKLQAQDMGKVGASQDLIRGIEKILDSKKSKTTKQTNQGKESISAMVESLLKRGYMSLEDGEFKEAKTFFNDALNKDAKNAEAYLGLFMAEIKAADKVEAAAKFTWDDYSENRHWKRAKQFATGSLQAELSNWEKERQDALAWEAKCDQERKANSEKRRQEAAQAFQRKSAEHALIRKEYEQCQEVICAGESHAVGLRSNGTVVAVGFNKSGACGVSDWQDIVAISAGSYHTVGLKSDGSVVATGSNSDGQCNVSDWTNIVKITAGSSHTVALRTNGSVVAVGRNKDGECNVSGWNDIIAISAGSFYTVGLKSDGTVVATGNQDAIKQNKSFADAITYKPDKRNVSNMRDIIAISAGGWQTIGLKADGTVHTVGSNMYKECNTSKWSEIVAISAGNTHTVGLKADGTVFATGDNKLGECNVSNWVNIVAISAGTHFTIGLKSDGTVVATGWSDSGQCDVGSWKLCDNSLQFREEAKNIRIGKLESERQKHTQILDQVKTDFSELHGPFAGLRRKGLQKQISELESKVAEIQKKIEAIH